MVYSWLSLQTFIVFFFLLLCSFILTDYSFIAFLGLAETLWSTIILLSSFCSVFFFSSVHLFFIFFLLCLSTVELVILTISFVGLVSYSNDSFL